MQNLGIASAPAVRKRAALQSLGCRLNHAETELIRSQLERAGYEIVEWGQPAELVLVNSCTVTAQADASSRQALRQARRHSPGAAVAVVGCYAQAAAPLLAREGLADLIVGNAEKLAVVQHLTRLESGAAPVVVRPPISRAPLAWEPLPAEAPGHAPAGSVAPLTRAHLKIQDGCNFVCSFCIIPRVRGPARPRALENLLAEARLILAGGGKEIVLTGVNLGTYGEDAEPEGAGGREPGAGLLRVVDRLDALPGLERIRISSIEPSTVHPGLLERMADPAHRLVPFLHLPLQSGSETVLRAMRRRHSARDYRVFAEQALRRVPHLCLGTDVMTGFPGESDADFEATLHLLRDLPAAYCHVFPYSERPGTAAPRLAASVPLAVRGRRAAALRALSGELRLAFHRRHVGATLPVLFERPTSGDTAQGYTAQGYTAQGYTANYIRVRVPHPAPGALRNQILPVHLLEAGSAVMAGELSG